ncbi:MAG: ABC transporter ATP-binding protein [Chloroflexi bacterium]|nr:MAG: ABC transporter ATP-binding protein [Chloroflexota bacterium]
MIKIQHIYKSYRKVDALKGLSLQIPQGSIYGLIGPNGAGKTTLIRILAALLAPTRGEVWFDGEEVVRQPALIQRKVGYMPDFFGVYPDLTAVEYLEFYAGIHGIPRKKQASTVNDLLELAEMCTDIAIIQGGQLVVAGDVEHVTRRIGGGRQIEIRVLERVPETTALLKEIEGINNVTRKW